jgi:hypothetical protein
MTFRIIASCTCTGTLLLGKQSETVLIKGRWEKASLIHRNEYLLGRRGGLKIATPAVDRAGKPCVGA